MWNSDASKASAAQQQANGNRQLGMTSAISMAEPKPEDIQKSVELEKALGKLFQEMYNS